MTLRAADVRLQLRPPGGAWKTAATSLASQHAVAIDTVHITWSQPTPRDHPEPGQITLTLLVPDDSPDIALLAYDTELIIDAQLQTWTGTSWAYISPSHAWTPLARGWVTSWTRDNRSRDDGRRTYQLGAIDVLGRAAATRLAADPWPGTHDNYQRRDAINAASPSGPLLIETGTPYLLTAPFDVDAAPALDVIRQHCAITWTTAETDEGIAVRPRPVKEPVYPVHPGTGSHELAFIADYARGDGGLPVVTVPARLLEDTGRQLDRTNIVSEVAVNAYWDTEDERREVTVKPATALGYTTSRHTIDTLQRFTPAAAAQLVADVTDLVTVAAEQTGTTLAATNLATNPTLTDVWATISVPGMGTKPSATRNGGDGAMNSSGGVPFVDGDALRFVATGTSTTRWSAPSGTIGNADGVSMARLGLQPGRTYAAAVLYSQEGGPMGTGPNESRALAIYTRTAAGTSSYTHQSISAPDTTQEDTRLEVAWTIPADAQDCSVMLHSGGTRTGASTRWRNLIICEGATEADALRAVASWFDGDTSDDPSLTVAWTGTPHRSSSTAHRRLPPVTSLPGTPRLFLPAIQVPDLHLLVALGTRSPGRMIRITDGPPDLDPLHAVIGGELTILGRDLTLHLALKPARGYGIRVMRFTDLPTGPTRPRLASSTQLGPKPRFDALAATFAHYH